MPYTPALERRDPVEGHLRFALTLIICSQPQRQLRGCLVPVGRGGPERKPSRRTEHDDHDERPGPQDAGQLDRLDSILDGLSDGLNEAVATAVEGAVERAVRQAVGEAVRETLQAV